MSRRTPWFYLSEQKNMSNPVSVIPETNHSSYTTKQHLKLNRKLCTNTVLGQLRKLNEEVTH